MIFRFTLLTALSAMVLLSSCGKTKKSHEDTAAVGAEDSKEEDAATVEQPSTCEGSSDASCSVFRVRSGDALGLHFSKAFGPESVVSVSVAGENLIDKYQTQLGSYADKKIGNITSDEVSSGNPMTGYFAVLSIIALNAGIYCQNATDERCACENEASATGMLNRAVSFAAFTGKEDLVQTLVSLCKKSRKDAITALASSLSFVKK